MRTITDGGIVRAAEARLLEAARSGNIDAVQAYGQRFGETYSGQL
jgi:hypothetical protein